VLPERNTFRDWASVKQDWSQMKGGKGSSKPLKFIGIYGEETPRVQRIGSKGRTDANSSSRGLQCAMLFKGEKKVGAAQLEAK